MSSVPAYNYGSTARKREEYELGYEAPRTGIEVMPGGARFAQPETVPHIIAVGVKVVIAVVAFIALTGAIRVSLDSVTIGAMMESQQISTAISEARSAGNTLEVQQSTLSNPVRIKDEATTLGMKSPVQTSFIDLSGDVVITDNAGNLSLTGSLAQASANAAKAAAK